MTKQGKNVRLNLEKLFDAGCRYLKYGGVIAMEPDPTQEDAPKFKLLTNGLDHLATSEDEFVITESGKDDEDYVFLKCVTTGIVVELSKTELWIATKPDNEFQVKIPGGYLIVEEKGAYDEYPGVCITFSKDGQRPYGEDCVAVVEFDNGKGVLQTACYNSGQEEPAEIIPYSSQEDLEEEMEYTASTDFSRIPESLKNEILKNHEKLKKREGEKKDGKKV